MKDIHYIDSKQLDFETLNELNVTGKTIKLSKEAVDKINNCRNYLDHRINKDS